MDEDEVVNGAARPEEAGGPLIVIESRRGAMEVGWRELFRYRELLYFLVWRDFRVRFRQAVLGFLWAVIRPLLSMAIYVVVFSRIARFPSEGVPYPVFVLAGMVPWLFFAGGVAGGAHSLVANAHLVTKVYFPRLVIPMAAVAGAAVDLCISTVLLLGVMLWMGLVPPISAVLTWPLLVCLAFLLTFGLGLILGALNVRFRDIGNLVPFLIQMLFFVTPIVYPSTLVPVRLRWLQRLNPLVGLVDGFRSALLGRPWDIESFTVCVSMSIAATLIGIAFFRSHERTFADTI